MVLIRTVQEQIRLLLAVLSVARVLISLQCPLFISLMTKVTRRQIWDILPSQASWEPWQMNSGRRVARNINNWSWLYHIAPSLSSWKTSLSTSASPLYLSVRVTPLPSPKSLLTWGTRRKIYKALLESQSERLISAKRTLPLSWHRPRRVF